MKLTKLLIISLAFVLFQSAAFAQEASERDKGIDLYRAGQFVEAIVILEKLVSDGRADMPTAHYLAGAYVHTDRKADAKKLLEREKDFKWPGTGTGSLDYDKNRKMTRMPRPDFGDPGNRARSGRITLLVEFKKDGKIGFVFPFKKTASILEPGAIQAAKQILFEPSEIGGEKVTTVGLIEYSYESY